jgi:hypothetical protein
LWRWIATADDSNSRAVQQADIALGIEQCRRIRCLQQAAGIFGVRKSEDAIPGLLRPAKCGVDVLRAVVGPQSLSEALRNYLREPHDVGLKDRLGRTKPLEQ